ncbi:MAG: UvrD-helicase domain-containing protein [Archaeoglobaceae archaeon]
MRLKIVGDAGTGKTTSILRYCKEFDAIILSHTRVAVNVINYRDPSVRCSTLHSFALRFPDFFGFAKKSLEIGIEKIRMEFCAKHGIPYSTNAYIKKKGNNLFTAYSKLVNTAYPTGDLSEFQDEVISFAEKYEKFKIEKGLIDYEDMLKYLYDVAEKGELVLGPVIVDEAQDLSPLQSKIINMSSEFIVMAGDELQSIFGFHGAKPEIFENFCNNSIILGKNYRIKKKVWDFTGKIVERQLRRKRAEAVNDGGCVQVLPPMGYKEIARLINSLQGKKMVLFRYNEDVVIMKAFVEDSENTIIDTIHACKGRECPTVILVDGSEEKRTEEEERVWYVGATRCRDHLIIIPFIVREPFLTYCYDFAEKADIASVISENRRILSENKSLSDKQQKREPKESPPALQVF